MANTVYPNKVNAVVAYYYFCNYHLGRLIKSLGAFPKYLYQPDVSSMKNIVRVMKNNGILCLFIYYKNMLFPYLPHVVIRLMDIF